MFLRVLMKALNSGPDWFRLLWRGLGRGPVKYKLYTQKNMN